jgi:glycosyltransferase involved in cell wall biosynthesis
MLEDARDAMNILFAGSLTPQQNGAARSSTELLNLLARSGHCVTAVAPITPEFASQERFDRVNHPGVEVLRFRMPFFESLIHPPSRGYQHKFRQQFITRLKQAIGNANADLILVGKEACVLSIPDFAHQAGLPCVVASRGQILGALDAVTRNERAAEVLREMRKADLIIACANHLAGSLRSLGMQRVATVVNAIDTTCFRPRRQNAALLQALAIPGEACVVAHASHLMPVKCPLDIVESAAIALLTNPDLFYLIIGGSSDYSQRDGMVAASRHLGIEDRFRFVEWQDHNLMPQYLCLADILVYSSASEGLCRGYLEAMACGRCLIASDIPAARDVINDGVNGWLYPKGKVETLAATTLAAAADPALRRRIGREARKTVVERHAYGPWLSAHEAAFDLAVRNHAGRQDLQRSA